MRIDLRLQRIKLLLAFRLMLTHNILHQEADLTRHITDRFSQMADLIGTSDVHRCA